LVVSEGSAVAEPAARSATDARAATSPSRNAGAVLLVVVGSAIETA
jgi:hypothetical protein